MNNDLIVIDNKGFSKVYYTCKYDTVFKSIFFNPSYIFILKFILEFIMSIKLDSLELYPSELYNDNVLLRIKGLMLFLFLVII